MLSGGHNGINDGSANVAGTAWNSYNGHFECVQRVRDELKRLAAVLWQR